MKYLKKWLGFAWIVVCLCLIVSCNSTTTKPTKIESETPTIVEIQNDISETYKRISAGCVGIYATTTDKGAVGSGVVYKEQNGLYYVVTNHHVIEDMKTIRIYRGGSRYLKANLVGSDPKNDIAVITFSLDLFGGDPVYVNDIFNYDEEIVSVGQTVLAIGCPISLDHFNTLTTGVVSRVTKTQLQTNAEINPGNSGGGLFNVSGRLIGINSQKEVYTTIKNEDGSTSSIPVEGLGYAIPLNVVKKSITDIEDKKGTIERPLLDVKLQTVNRYVSKETELIELLPNSMDEAVVITKINPGNAMSAGIQLHDIILEANESPIENRIDLESIMFLLMVGDHLTLKIYRPSTKEIKTITMVLK